MPGTSPGMTIHFASVPIRALRTSVASQTMRLPRSRPNSSWGVRRKTYSIKRPASADRSAGKTPLPSTVARRLALADKHVAANGIVQALDAGFERQNDRANHRADKNL
jgi:hypothetical protein